MATLEEITANLTWYKLNSNFKDPMFQYMLFRQLQLSNYKPPIPLNISETDNFVVDKSGIFRHGTFECSVLGKEAYMDSAFTCFLFKLPYFLEHINFGYIGFVFVLPIMLISIFGGIKESYRWFILHQAIWDAFLCYDFICAKPTLIGWFGDSYLNSTTCFYYLENNPNPIVKSLGQAFRDFLRNGSFIPIFLLAFSRFLAMYFSRFYKSFTKYAYKILAFIFVFNLFFMIILCTRRLYFTLTIFNFNNEHTRCFNVFCIPVNETSLGNSCYMNVPAYFQCVNRETIPDLVYNKIIQNMQYAVSPLMLFLSIICAGFLLYKIVSQIKFQLKTNRVSFIQTLKISSVVGFQCCIMSIISVITLVQKFLQIKSVGAASDFSIYNTLPKWLFFLQYPTTTLSLNIIRVFLDSIIVLTVLTGYSSSVVKIFKFAFLCLTNPALALKKVAIFFNFQNNRVTVISSSKKLKN